MREFEEIKKQLSEKSRLEDGIFVYLPEVSEFQRKEIDFHDQIHQDEEQVHQLKSLRNRYYHNYFQKWLFKNSAKPVLLEIGSGSGLDIMESLKRGAKAIISDISFQSLRAIKDKIKGKRYEDNCLYLACDGQNLPLPDSSIQTVLLVATLHHFEDQSRVLTEIKRVIQENGLIVLAMEPSKMMMKVTKLFKNNQGLRIYDGHSEADEAHQGYSLLDFLRFAGQSKLEIIKVKRVWLLQGFMHYGLEACYRLFKLKKRLKLPKTIEYLLLILDEILLRLPLVKNLNWHWIVILKKNDH